MIGIDRFENEHQQLVNTCMSTISEQLSQLLGKEFSLILQTNIDAALLKRMEQLEEEAFSIENNVYNKKDILECLAEEDSLLLLALIDGEVEGYVFGYEEDIDNPTVKGTDYFLDSAIVSRKYERKGIASTVSGIVLLLLYLLGYQKIGILTEEQDKTGRKLLGFYQKLGFEHVETTEELGSAMKIELTMEKILQTFKQFGIPVSSASFA